MCAEQGLTAQTLRDETIRRALQRLHIGWKRAKHWISSSDPAYARKKQRDRPMRLATHAPDWVVGYPDAVWFSRLAPPPLPAWTQDEPLRLVAPAADKADTAPKAIACYGLLRADTGQRLLRFVAGRPVSHVTMQFRDGLLGHLAQAGKRVVMMVWDKARWHTSREVNAWVNAHNRRVKAEGGCRLLVCAFPSRSPWLNNIEPKWVAGKRKTAEPDRKLSATALKERLCAYYQCELLEPLAQQLA